MKEYKGKNLKLLVDWDDFKTGDGMIILKSSTRTFTLELDKATLVEFLADAVREVDPGRPEG